MLKSTPEVNPTDAPSEMKPLEMKPSEGTADAAKPGQVNASGATAGRAELRALFEEEESKLLRLAFSFVGRRAVAEEIVQDVFLLLHVHWDRVDEPRAWLVRSIRNRALNHLRKTRREFWLDDDGAPSAEDDCETPDAALEKLETVAAMRQLGEELAEGDQRLIELRYFKGLKYREISSSVGLTVSNVGFRLHRILQQLASRMQSQRVADESETGES